MVTLTPQQALAELRSPLIAYRESLDSAITFADTQMANLPTCSFTWSTLVRYWAWQEVKRRKSEAPKWGAKRLANNGMEISLNGHRIRPFKALDAQPPAPGHSRVRQDYYQQRGFEQSSFDFEEPILPSSGVNLILDWTLGDKRTTVLSLSKPVGLWRFRGNPQLEWRVVVRFDDGGDGQPLSFKPSDDGDDFDLRRKIDTSEISLSEQA